MIKKNIVFFTLLSLTIIFTLSMINAFSLDSSVTINTSASNSSMSFNGVTIQTSNLTVNSTGVFMSNVSYIRGDLTLNFTGPFNWTNINDHIDSGEMPILSLSNNTLKQIASNLPYSINASFRVPITESCADIETINYTNVAGDLTSYSGAGAVALCSSNVITITDLEIQVNVTPIGLNNLIISYESVPIIVEIILGDGPCDLFDIRCIFVNELTGSVVIAMLVLLLLYFIIAWKMRFGFETTIVFFVPFALGIASVIVGFSVIFAFITIIVGLMLAWLFQKIISR